MAQIAEYNYDCQHVLQALGLHTGNHMYTLYLFY